MKKTLYIILLAFFALTAASCQKAEEKSIDVATSGGLTVTGSIAGYDGTRILYSFENDAKSGLKTSWEEGDRIFGFDDKGVAFTFIVSDIQKGVAKFVGDYAKSSGAKKLYAIYYPGKGIEDLDLDNKSLSVDISSQNGTLGTYTPAIMCATSEIGNDGSVNFYFENQTAIVGIYKMTLKEGDEAVDAGEKITGVTLHDVNTKGTIRINTEGTLGLDSQGSAGYITAPVDLTTKEGGIIKVDLNNPSPYFAVIPTTAGQIGITAFNESNLYSAQSISQSGIAAGEYYYIGKTIEKAVARIGNTGYNSLAEAIAAAGNDETTITLMRSVDISSTLTIETDNSIILDLAGKTITGSGQAPLIAVNGILTINDSKSGTTPGTITNTANCLKVNNCGLLILNGGILEGDKDNDNNEENSATVIVQGESATYVNTTKAVFNGGKITQKGSTNKGALYIEYSTVEFPKNSTTEVLAEKDRTVYAAKGTDLSIKGGAIKSTVKYPFFLNITDNGSSVDISGGEFEGRTYCFYSYNNNRTLDISGGKFKWGSDKVFSSIGSGTLQSNISGGLFGASVTVPSGFECQSLSLAIDEYNFKVVPKYDVEYTCDGKKSYKSISTAVENANSATSDCTIKLLKEAFATSGLTINNTKGVKVTLDLNGKTLNGKITTKTDFEINDSSNTPGKNDGTGKIVNEDIYVKGGDTPFALRVREQTKRITITMNGGTLESAYRPLYVFSNNNGAEINLNNCIIRRIGEGNEEQTLSAAYFKDCTVVVGSATQEGSVYIEGQRPFEFYTGSDVTFNKGRFKATGSSSKSAMGYLDNSTATITINGGTFDNLSATQFFTYNSNSVNPTVNISDGEFSWRLNFAKDYHTNLSITGGKFISDIALNLSSQSLSLPNNFICDGPNSEDEPYKYTVTDGFVKVGDTYYSSVSAANDAIADAESDVTVKFVKSLTLEDQLKISNNRAKITLDLNGKKVYASSSSISSVVVVQGALTVVDIVDRVGGGFIDHRATSGTTYTLKVESGTANLLNAELRNYKGEATIQNSYGRIAVGIAATGGDARFNVLGGKISGGRAIRCISGDGSSSTSFVTVSGGLLEGASTNADGSNGAAVCLSGGKNTVLINGGTIVGKSTAVYGSDEAANAGSTINITKNRKTGVVPFIYTTGEYSVASGSEEAGTKLFNGCDWNFYTNNSSVMNVGDEPTPTEVSVRDKYNNIYNCHMTSSK